MRDQPVARYRSQSGMAMLSLIVIGVVVLAVAGVAIGGTYLVMRTGPSAPAADKQDEEKPPPEPVFVTIEPFTVNLQSSQGRVLYLGLSLAVPGEHAAERVDTHLPQVRNRILMLISNRQAQTLATPEGKTQLARTLREQLQKPFTENGEGLEINEVLFTNFILQ